jgi:hypothetical protein
MVGRCMRLETDVVAGEQMTLMSAYHDLCGDLIGSGIAI